MADTDLSRIVNLIMENPKLIEEIKSIASSEKSESADSVPAATEVTAIEEQPPDTSHIKKNNTPLTQKKGQRTRRSELLRALKPYVSNERGKAIESMISITDVLDMMRDS